MDFASEEAARRSAEVIDTVDIVVGLIRDGDGVAAHVLRADSITIELAWGARDLVFAGPDVTMMDVESQAAKQAAWLGHCYVGTEHLLLALCCLRTGKAAQLFASLGKSPVQLCSFDLEILGHHEEWDRWLLDHRDLVGPCDVPIQSYSRRGL